MKALSNVGLRSKYFTLLHVSYNREAEQLSIDNICMSVRLSVWLSVSMSVRR